ncbi:MAG: relaxase/mobilization nuclease domain-containing protein [Nitrosomonas sp.]|nr:MAG: relaxase/mobilization nuclease domain-containing protein [Nitrosomonas sp.]
MVAPKIASKGTSFKGAGQYYLHDKNASTSNRVAFIYTENLATNNPDMALKMMAYTAMHQGDLKAQSGQVKTGRKVAASVYSYSLSWDIGQDPPKEEMIDAARETLKVLGLQHHEALFIAHNDTNHPHIHVIVNRIHPETGIVNTHSNDQLKLSKWAEAYEKKEGQIRCPQRVDNNEKRRLGQFVKYRKNQNYKEAQQFRKAQQKQAQDHREIEQDAISPDIKDQKLALFMEKEARIAFHCQQVGERNQSKWTELYHRQREEEQKLQETKETVYARFKHWLKTRDANKERGFLAGVISAILSHTSMYKQLMARHKNERKALARENAEQNQKISNEENQLYKAELDQLDRLHKQEQQPLKQAYAGQSQDQNRSDEKTKADQQPSQTLSEEFKKQAEGRRKKRRERDERSRGKDHGRERD